MTKAAGEMTKAVGKMTKDRRVKRPKPADAAAGLSSPSGTSPAVHGTHMKQLRIPEIQMIQ